MPKRSSLVLALVLLAACEQFQATADRAVATLQGKTPPASSSGGSGQTHPRDDRPAVSIAESSCPAAVDGRAAGAESPDAALSCFRRAIASESAAMMLRVTCRGRVPSSCKQSDATIKEAEQAMADLKKTPWSTVLGKWDEGAGDKKAVVFAIDTKPGERVVSTVVLCKIAEGGRWAVCEIGELSRETAAQKAK